MTLREFADRLDTIALPVNVIAAEARQIADEYDTDFQAIVTDQAHLRTDLEDATATIADLRAQLAALQPVP